MCDHIGNKVHGYTCTFKYLHSTRTAVESSHFHVRQISFIISKQNLSSEVHRGQLNPLVNSHCFAQSTSVLCHILWHSSTLHSHFTPLFIALPKHLHASLPLLGFHTIVPNIANFNSLSCVLKQSSPSISNFSPFSSYFIFAAVLFSCHFIFKIFL
jgi:hypothetical protein